MHNSLGQGHGIFLRKTYSHAFIKKYYGILMDFEAHENPLFTFMLLESLMLGHNFGGVLVEGKTILTLS